MSVEGPHSPEVGASEKIERFKAQPTELPTVFRLEDGRIFCCVHFENGVFKDSSKQEIDIATYVHTVMREYEASGVVLSCCYPDTARTILPPLDNVELVGSGTSEVSVRFNDVIGELRVISPSES